MPPVFYAMGLYRRMDVRQHRNEVNPDYMTVASVLVSLVIVVLLLLILRLFQGTLPVQWC
jgi:hypothetical protein